MNIHIGCGYAVGKSWKNYDCTPTSRIEKIPIIGKFININERRFPKEVMYGDIVKGPLTETEQAENIYCSHTLEHLPLESMRKALVNIQIMLKKNGTFRLIVPSLENRVKKYQNDQDAHKFIELISMGKKTEKRSIIGKLRNIFGNTSHCWMYDNKSMLMELKKANFINIRKCQFGDSNISVFSEVEEESRFYNDGGDPEIAFQCSK